MIAILLDTIAGHDPVTDPEAVRAAMGWMPDTLGSWPSLSAGAWPF